MSDYKSGLPVRSEADGTDERLQTKIVDATSPDTQQMEVDSDNNAHVEVHGNNPASGDEVLRLSEQGHAAIDGLYDGTNNTDPSNIAVIAHSRNATPGDTQATERLTSIEDSAGEVRALDISLHDEAGEPYSQTNPLPVSVEESEGDEVADPDQATSIASDASSNHDYTVTAAKTLVIHRISCTASGRAKFELQVETGVATDTWTSIDWSFNSTANPNAPIIVDRKVTVAAGVRVRIVKTNRDNQPQDLYSTIYGIEK